jgi:hypothetical protein
MGVYHGIPAKWHCRETASRQTHVFNCTNYFVQVGYRWEWLNFFTYPLVIKRGMLENTSFVDLVRWFSHHWQPGRHWTPDWTWLFGSSFQYQTCQTIDVLGVHEKLIVPSFNPFLGHFRWRNKIQQTWPSHGPFDIFWRTVWEHQTSSFVLLHESHPMICSILNGNYFLIIPMNDQVPYSLLYFFNQSHYCWG